MAQFERKSSIPQSEVEEHIGDFYSSTVWLVPITDSAQGEDIIAWVPETQVESLLAHLNGA